MEMTYCTPEQAGVRPERIEEFLRILEEHHFSMHDVILVRGNRIFFEKYYAPFEAEAVHRMYSVSKSFVALAIGFLEQDGKIGLDDPMEKYFPEELKGQPDRFMHEQTIRHMLMMATAKETERSWFTARTDDRVRFYFENDAPARPSGTIFNYDSTGSFILCALVERVTGMAFMDYLREKLFRHIGISERARILKCPGGHSWGDSAMLLRPRDLLLAARFVLNYGKWDGKQLLNEKYLREATSCLITNDFLEKEGPDIFGYGYYFWRTYEDSFYFNGMGSQYAVCVPSKDMIFVCNADNQGRDDAAEVIIHSFFRLIADEAAGGEIPEDRPAERRLAEYAASLRLACAAGAAETAWDGFCGKTYSCGANRMGLKWFSLSVEGTRGSFRYENAQGEKELVFGLGHNEFGLFPEEGYSDETGSVRCPGHRYRCAASAAWAEPQKIHIKVQIIDTYLGRLDITIGFGENTAGVYMVKSAEDFLGEYEGFAGGTAVPAE